MKISKSYKFKLLPDKDQSILCAKSAGCCRQIWNTSLDTKIKLWKTEKKSESEFDLNNRLVALKTEFEYLKEAPSQALQQVNKDLHQAFSNFFRRCKKGEVPGFPKFKKKGIHDAFRFPQGIKLLSKLNKKTGAVKLPKLGPTKFVLTQKIEGRIRNVTVSKNAGEWFIAFNCELEVDAPERTKGLPIGIDRGVKVFMAISTGELVMPVMPLKKNRKKLTKLQRRVKNKKRFSKNWLKQKRRISKIHHHIANVRKDYLHKHSTRLAKNHRLVVLEKLKIANMTRSAKGTIENPGKNVKAKSGLNRSILDQGWFSFKVMLEYKLGWSGGRLISVPAQFTSQTCLCCGKRSPHNRQSQSKFECQTCGYAENADVNAARNILAEGLSVMACGGVPVRDPLKQETLFAKAA